MRGSAWGRLEIEVRHDTVTIGKFLHGSFRKTSDRQRGLQCGLVEKTLRCRREFEHQSETAKAIVSKLVNEPGRPSNSDKPVPAQPRTSDGRLAAAQSDIQTARPRSAPRSGLLCWLWYWAVPFSACRFLAGRQVTKCYRRRSLSVRASHVGDRTVLRPGVWRSLCVRCLLSGRQNRESCHSGRGG